MDADKKLEELKQALANWGSNDHMAAPIDPPALTISSLESYDLNPLESLSISPLNINDLLTTSLTSATLSTSNISLGSINANWTTGASLTSGTVTVQGSLDVQGEESDITVNGQSLSSWMKNIEQRLNILTANPKLEQEWEELAELGRRYRELEQSIKNRMQTWNTMKSMPPPTEKF
jgi:hypothetical protein